MRSSLRCRCRTLPRRNYRQRSAVVVGAEAVGGDAIVGGAAVVGGVAAVGGVEVAVAVAASVAVSVCFWACRFLCLWPRLPSSDTRVRRSRRFDFRFH